jgi:hypothetical protein
MRRHARRILFWTFAALFFVTAPVVTVYALGYRFSFERGIFIYTGSVTLKANPATVSITVDGKPDQGTIDRINDSYHIGGLKPGEHFIEVSAPGYRTWSKKAIVNSGISTEFWNVLLVREDYSRTVYPASPALKAFPAPQSNLLAYVTLLDGGLGVGVLDIDENRAEQVFSTKDYSFSEDDKENIEWSIDSGYLSIPLYKDGRKEYFVVDRETKETLSLKEIAQAPDIGSVRWDSARDNVLFYLSSNGLYEMDINNPSEKRLLSEKVQSYDISGEFIYVLETPSGIVYRARLGDPESRTQVTTVPPADLGDLRYSLIVYDERRLALLNYHTGTLFTYNAGERDTTFTRLSSEARGAQFSNDGKKFLYWTDWEIFVYFAREWEAQPFRRENSVVNIGRFSQVIRSVHWAKDYEHVVFSVGSEVKVIELDQRERSLTDVLRLSEPPAQVLSNFIESKLFYVAPAPENGVPAVQSIGFPEKPEGFLGIGR